MTRFSSNCVKVLALTVYLLALTVVTSRADIVGSSRRLQQTMPGDCLPDSPDVKQCPTWLCERNVCENFRSQPSMAKCVVRGCNISYRGVKYPPCTPIWYSPRTGNLVNCGKYHVDNITACPAKNTWQWECFSNAFSCAGYSCASNPNANCIIRRCPGVYRGKQLPSGCDPIWYNATTGDLVSCDPKVTDDITKCPQQSVSVDCSSSPPQTCSNSTCPSSPNATCIVRNCTGYYRGVSLPVLEPIFYNPTTGDLISDCSCSKCSRQYNPVCAVDNVTYPSWCIASCLGKTVARIGKCSNCTDFGCLYASRGEMCVMDGNQCERSLTCTLAARSKAGEVFGTCQ